MFTLCINSDGKNKFLEFGLVFVLFEWTGFCCISLGNSADAGLVILKCYRLLNNAWIWYVMNVYMERRVKSLHRFSTQAEVPPSGINRNDLELIGLSWFTCSCVKFGFGFYFLQLQLYSIEVCVCLFVDLAIFPSLGLPDAFTSVLLSQLL